MSISRSAPASAYGRSAAATSSTEPNNRCSPRACEPVLEASVARPEIVDRACPVHCLVTGLPDDAVDGDREAHRRRIAADLGAGLYHTLADVGELLGTRDP